MSKRAFLWACVALLLVYFALRLVDLMAFPPFIDEAFHVNFGRDVLNSGLLAHSEEGRQFVVWLYILVGAPINAPLWSARAADLIVLLPGLAATMGAARLLSNRWGALFAALLVIFSPYNYFFERLALADPVSASAILCALYFACRLRVRAASVDAVLCGFALFVACGAKISALPYLALPVIAVLTLRRSREGIRWVALAVLVEGILTGVYLGVLFWRGYNPFFYLETGPSAPLTTVILTNIRNTWLTLAGYFGLPAALLLLITLVIMAIKRRLFLPLSLILPLAVFWLSPRQDSRHLIAPMTLLLLTGAVALGDLVQAYPALGWPLLAAATIWGLALWLPFAYTEITAPVNLALPTDDHAEYMAAEGSGFGLAEVIDALKPQQPARVIGVLANCLSLHDLAPFPVECPGLNPNGADIASLADLLASSRAAGTYAVLEAIPYAPPSAPGTVIASIDVGRPRLTIYSLAP